MAKRPSAVVEKDLFRLHASDLSAIHNWFTSSAMVNTQFTAKAAGSFTPLILTPELCSYSGLLLIIIYDQPFAQSTLPSAGSQVMNLQHQFTSCPPLQPCNEPLYLASLTPPLTLVLPSVHCIFTCTTHTSFMLLGRVGSCSRLIIFLLWNTRGGEKS